MNVVMFASLPLNSSRRLAADERVDFGDAGAVEVAVNSLLERAGRDREPQCRIRRAIGQQSVDQPGGKAVAAADSVDERNDISLAVVDASRRRVPQDRAPAV